MTEKFPLKKRKIVHRKVAELVPYARNSRTHSDAQIDQIAASIREFGWTNPILVDESGGLIAGHGRLLAAAKVGIEEAPCIVIDGLSEAQKRALIIADNKLAMNAGWDEELLASEILGLGDEGFDLSLLGFDADELAALLADKTDGLTDPDDAPEPPVDPVSRLGDVWLLGKHRIVCGDSTDDEALGELLQDELADLVVTDPPYGVSFQSGMSKGGTATRFAKLANDDMILEIAPIIDRALKNGGAMFVWTGHQVYPQWREQFARFYKQTIIWHKPGGGIGDLAGNYATDYEMCIFGAKGRARFRGKRGMAVWTISKDQVLEYRHPTQKPVELAERAITDFSDPGQKVLDLFSGSGSTIVACERTGRICLAAELAPAYVDVAIIRWQEFTGAEAVHAETGRTFAQEQAARAEEREAA